MSKEKHQIDQDASAGGQCRPKAKTPMGRLEIGDARVECYVLQDGHRVISQTGAVRALTGGGSGKRDDLGRYLARLPSRFAELATRAAVEFERLEGGVAHGRDARWFVDVCQAYVEAGLAGELHPKQMPIARNAQVFVKAAATVGIEALVDEACGHVPDGDDSVSARFIRELFRDEPRRWERFWPADVVRELCRTFRIRQTQAFPAPLMGVIGKLYNLRLGSEAHEELKRINPRGEGRDMHFQHFGDRLFDTFTGDMQALRALLLVSSSKDQFWELWTTYCTGRGQLRLGW